MTTKEAQRLVYGNLVTVNNPEHHPKLKDVPMMVTFNNKGEDGHRIIGFKYAGNIKNGHCKLRSQHDESIDPIYLTTEWFERFGAIFIMNHLEFKVKVKRFDVVELENRFFYNDGLFMPELNYVHQLQNLYFALTEEELQINL